MPKVTNFTRREFYDLVWSKPMIKLADELGVSDVALIKICRKHDIVRPPQGHWNRVLAGRPVLQIPFSSKSNDDDNDKVVFVNSPYNCLSDEALAIIRSAKAAVKIAQQQAVDSIITLDNTELHPALERTAAVLRKSKPVRNGMIEARGEALIGITVTWGCAERTLSLLSNLAYHLERLGYALKAKQSALHVSSGVDSISISIEELVQYVPHVLTDKEQAKEENWKRRQEKASRLNNWHWDPKPEFLKYDPVYTGRLSLKIPGYDRGLRRTWNDGKYQRLEAMLDIIVIGISALLASRKADREIQEERNRKWEEEQRRRKIADQHKEREIKRKTYLNEILSIHDEINRLRSWLAHMKTKEGSISAASRMVEWTFERLEFLEQKVSVQRIEAHLTATNMFPEQDELIYQWAESTD